MIGLILTLVIVGVILYFLEQLPMDPICVLLWLIQFLGVANLPLPRWRR
jgi:hypothetical protein